MPFLAIFFARVVNILAQLCINCLNFATRIENVS